LKENTMTRTIFGAATLAAVVAAGAVAAGPLKVTTPGAKSQSVLMCEDCKSKVACAKAGDYTVGLGVDQDNPKLGGGRITVHVRDAAKNPVSDAKVTVALSMPEHQHGGKPVALKHQGHGKYVATVNNLGMSGTYKADVAVTTSGGDTVKQSFGFTK
jgi:hypothetical protein